MKLNHATFAALAAAALLLPSCSYIYAPGAATVSAAYAYDSSELWTEASYDSNGFPIFGYYYGRPVYGYTAAGDAVFALNALVASCYVPHWGPAPWYTGHWHYPSHIHRVAAPPHFPGGHRPNVRPHGGMHSPINRHPGNVFGGPGRPGGHQPGAGLNPPGGHKPGAGGNRPGGNKPAAGGNRPGGNKPAAGGNRPGGHKPAAGGNRPGGHKPAAGGNRPGGHKPAAGGNRPGGHKPAAGGNRPGAHMPAGGGHRPGGRR